MLHTQLRSMDAGTPQTSFSTNTPPRKPASHRKSWLDRICNNTRARFSPTAYFTTIIFLVLSLLSQSSFALSSGHKTRHNADLFDLTRRSPTPSVTSAIPIDTASASAFTLPTAFDASIGNNFTQTACQDWFTGFVKNIEPCVPVSLMLQTSQSFFDATKSLVTITRVLDAACSVDYSSCSAEMSSYAHDIMRPEVCLQDYKMQNPVLTQAYAGLLAYQPLHAATCLKEPESESSGSSSSSSMDLASSTTQRAAAPTASTISDSANPIGRRQFTTTTASSSGAGGAGSYCFASAVTNATSPSSSYFYYLPLGFGLPGGTVPSCDTCLQQTMKGFAQWATNATQPLSQSYAPAANDVNLFCGPGFVAVTQAAVTGGGGRVVDIALVRWATLVLVVAGWVVLQS